MSKKAVCIMSGGMDSTLGAYLMKERGFEIVAVHFNYDQRTEKKSAKPFIVLPTPSVLLRNMTLTWVFSKNLVHLP